MAEGWLRRTGYPTLTYGAVRYANGLASVTLKQSGFEGKPEGANMPWIFPVFRSPPPPLLFLFIGFLLYTLKKIAYVDGKNKD
jgi:hypothetical protein